MRLIVVLATLVGLASCARLEQIQTQIQTQEQWQAGRQVEAAVMEAATQPEQEESYQRVYEAFSRLMQQTASSSLGNVHRLVSRLNRLVGQPQPQPQEAQVQVQVPAVESPAKVTVVSKVTKEQSVDERTEQILNRLDKVTKDTDQHTLAQLNEDISRLVGTLNESYLHNLRRVIERVNRVVGSSSSGPSNVAEPLHQTGDRLQDDIITRQPGFPGWDEFITAVDRMQKSLANFVRSSTRLVTSG